MRVAVRKFDVDRQSQEEIEMELNGAVGQGEQIAGLTSGVIGNSLLVILSVESDQERVQAISEQAAKADAARRQASLKASMISARKGMSDRDEG